MIVQGYKLLDFLSLLLEHPLAKVLSSTFYFLTSNHLLHSFFIVDVLFHQTLLLKEGTLQILTKVLGRIDAHVKSVSNGRSSLNSRFNIYNCCLPVLRSLSLICETRSAQKLHLLLDGLVNEQLFPSLFKYHCLFYH